MKALYVLLLHLVFISHAVNAQQEFETDRPDQTENSALVPEGRFQFETGFQHEQTSYSEREFTAPAIFSKYGLTEHIELRLTTAFIYASRNETEVYGMQQLKIGTKIKIFEETESLPAFSFIGQL